MNVCDLSYRMIYEGENYNELEKYSTEQLTKICDELDSIETDIQYNNMMGKEIEEPDR